MSSRTNPFETIERMFDQMRRQMDQAARAWESGESGFGESGFGRMGVDVADRGDEFVVTADVPGFETEDIQLRMMNSTLEISATREESTEEGDETYLRSERSHRSVRERVQLPEPIQEDEIDASLRNGVLTVHLPKATPMEGEGHQIEIE